MIRLEAHLKEGRHDLSGNATEEEVARFPRWMVAILRGVSDTRVLYEHMVFELQGATPSTRGDGEVLFRREPGKPVEGNAKYAIVLVKMLEDATWPTLKR